MKPDKMSNRDTFSKFNVKKGKSYVVCWIIFFHALISITKFDKNFLLFQASFVTRSFQISSYFKNLVAHFTLWQYCCSIFQHLACKLFTFFHIMPTIGNYPVLTSACYTQFSKHACCTHTGFFKTFYESKTVP